MTATEFSLKIFRILHAGYIFECDKIKIVFDPIFENPFSQNCYAFPEVKFDVELIKKLNFSAVFISHFHDDHCSLESLNFIDRHTPIYAYCLHEELFTLIQQLGFLYVYPLQLNKSICIGEFEIIPKRALDAEIDSIFHIKAAGLNILNVVDSWIDDETLAQLAGFTPWDLVLWPFQTLREVEVLSPSRSVAATGQLPMEWLEQLTALSPRYVVPSSCQFLQESWSWYNNALFPITYKQFSIEVKVTLKNTEVVRLNPGVGIILDKNSLKLTAPLGWIAPIGEQNLDYFYDPNLKPPTTAEISRHFAPLSLSQTERVFNFCRLGLLEKFRSLGATSEPYFQQPRGWQLSVYDHAGKMISFYYRLNQESIELVEDCAAPIEWTTEIPIVKLFAAVENGEALTSLYVRINDIVFAPEIENEIENKIGSADVFEDPLIRCLFTGVFGAYQIAQLKKLRQNCSEKLR